MELSSLTLLIFFSVDIVDFVGRTVYYVTSPNILDTVRYQLIKLTSVNVVAADSTVLTFIQAIALVRFITNGC